MPVYSRKCNSCGKVFDEYSRVSERDYIKCSCGGDTSAVVSNFNRGYVIKPQWFEHLDTKPVFIENRQHLIRECKKRGVWAKCLD